MLSKNLITTIIYHSPCNDGFGAAFIAYIYNKNYEFIGAHPNDEPPDVIGKSVLVVDISWSLQDMKRMYKQTNGNLLILDHHKTAEEVLKHLPYAHFNMNKSGLMLAWDYFFPNKKLPTFLYYIGLKDIWKHESDPEAVAFTTAFNEEQTFEAWIPYYRDDVGNGKLRHSVCQKGFAIIDYNKDILNILAKQSYITEWTPNNITYKVVIVNVGYPWTSDLGNYLGKKYQDAVILLWTKKFDHDVVSYSMRSNSKIGPDVSIIATYYEGGGHAHAAGFRSVYYPNELIK